MGFILWMWFEQYVCIYTLWPISTKWTTVFVNVDGPIKGLAVSFATISCWITQTVVQAYAIRGQTPPFLITAHSTKAVRVSQVCKAATLLSFHTLTKLYKVVVLYLRMLILAARFCRLVYEIVKVLDSFKLPSLDATPLSN